MLRDLKGLLDDGIITEEEFLDKKKNYLQDYDVSADSELVNLALVSTYFLH